MGYRIRFLYRTLAVKRFAALTLLLALHGAAQQPRGLIRPDAAQVARYRDPRQKVGVALLVGIKNYKRDRGLPPLDYPRHDVEALAKVLEDQRYLVRVLDEVESSREDIRTQIQEMGDLLDAGMSTFIFYFSGHGYLHDGRNMLALWDTNWARDPATGFPIDEVDRLMKASNARHRVLWIDACRESFETRTATPFRNFQAFRTSEGTKVLLAAKLDRRSYETEKLKHGVFTHFLMEGLKGAAATAGDDFITFHDLSLYVTNAVREYASTALKRTQVPHEAGESQGEFLIANAQRSHRHSASRTSV